MFPIFWYCQNKSEHFCRKHAFVTQKCEPAQVRKKKKRQTLKKDAEKDNSHYWWKEEAVLWREDIKLGTLQFGEEKTEEDMLKVTEITVVVDEINLIHRLGKIPWNYRRLI